MAEGSNENIIPINIEDEMRGAYIDYSMSVIISRALPDVRDGLKPVHRRVLYGMQDLGVNYNKAHKKSARIVGEVLGKYGANGTGVVIEISIG
jgi:DNA gyrase subunit A